MKPILANHLIWSTYGFWFPNEERGSWSTQVWAEHLRRFGPATKTNARRSVAHRPFDPRRRAEMRATLKYPPVRLDGMQARAAVRGFVAVAAELGLTVYACAVMPDHVHLVTADHGIKAEALATRFKSGATKQMTIEGIRPLAGFRDRHGRVPTPWAQGGWEVFLHTPSEVRGRIAYVEGNPEQAELRRQRWNFVQAFRG